MHFFLILLFEPKFIRKVFIDILMYLINMKFIKTLKPESTLKI
jgi:hypothetical protein